MTNPSPSPPPPPKSNVTFWAPLGPKNGHSDCKNRKSDFPKSIFVFCWVRNQRGPGDLKKITPTHEIFILVWIFYSWFKIFIPVWNVQSRALFFCGQRGARNTNKFSIENVIPYWKLASILRFEIDFFNLGALWVLGLLNCFYLSVEGLERLVVSICICGQCAVHGSPGWHFAMVF